MGLAGSWEGVTSVGRGTSAEGDATAARSRAREGNENQLKAELLFQGLPRRGGFQWQKLEKFVFFLARSAPPHHCPSLSGGGGAEGGRRQRRAAPGAQWGAPCLLLPCPPLVAELLSPQPLPLCRCGKGQGQRRLWSSPQLKHHMYMRPYWSQELWEVGAFGDEETEARRGDMCC